MDVQQTPTEAEAQAYRLSLPDTRIVPIEDLVPYWRNPRQIPDQAVQAVVESITRYGYQQPIVVDRDMVVIVGHTRLQALKQIGATEVTVYVSSLPEQKAREYRLADNRISEMSSWDHASLVMELREWETSLLETYFPDVDLEVARIEDAMVTQQQVDQAVKNTQSVEPRPDLHLTKVECPACLEVFEVKTSTLPGLTLADMAELTDHGSTED